MKAPEINTDIGDEPEVAWVNLDEIEVNRDYQRDLRPQRVKQILREFTWSKFGALTLARREDGRFNVYDGQHRHAAALKHPGVTAVPAVICDLEGRAEADAFLGVNTNRTAVTPVERYHAGIEAGDEEMMAVCAVLEEADCEVVPKTGQKAPNRTTAVQAVRRAIKHYGEGPTTGAVRVIRNAWPEDVDSLNGVLIQALARLIRNNPQCNRTHFAQALRQTGRRELTASAEAMRKLAGGDAIASLSKALVEIYNKGLRATQQIAIGVKR